MVKFPKSNWIKYGLFLLFFTLVLSSPLSDSTAATNSDKTDTQVLPAVQAPAIAAVETSKETVVELPEVKQPTSTFATPSGLALKIDAINLNISLSTTTLGKNRELLVPANPNVAAWYKTGPKIGEAGTALITGHYDSEAGPGVFFNLRKLTTGDVIEVRRNDGKVATYKVEKSESYAQDATFPWNKVYSTSGFSSLRIITCDGVYNPKTTRYSRNLVVYASLVSLE